MRVAFSGKKGSGKTTAAEYLVEEHGFTRVSLASPIKEMATIKDETDEDYWYVRLYEWAEKLLPDPIYGRRHPSWYAGSTPREHLTDLWERDFDLHRDYRDLLQRMGTDSGRGVNPYVWINWFARHLPEGDLVMDDLRFSNEFDAVHDLNFTIVKIQVDKPLRMARLVERDGFFDPVSETHASETELEGLPADVEITNKGDIQVFRHAIDAAVLDPPAVLFNES